MLFPFPEGNVATTGRFAPRIQWIIFANCEVVKPEREWAFALHFFPFLTGGVTPIISARCGGRSSGGRLAQNRRSGSFAHFASIPVSQYLNGSLRRPAPS